jgi:hypothetical protein
MIDGLIWDWAGQLGESGKYHMRRVRVVYFLIRSSECGICRLCRLRPASVGPWGSSIDYVLTHIKFMGFHKLSSYDSRWVERHLTTLVVMYTGIVYGPPTDAHRDIAWKTCTRVRWARLDSLIVVMNYGCSWCLRKPCVSYCHVLSIVRCILIWISATLSNMSEAWSLCPNVVILLS